MSEWTIKKISDDYEPNEFIYVKEVDDVGNQYNGGSYIDINKIVEIGRPYLQLYKDFYYEGDSTDLLDVPIKRYAYVNMMEKDNVMYIDDDSYNALADRLGLTYAKVHRDIDKSRWENLSGKKKSKKKSSKKK